METHLKKRKQGWFGDSARHADAGRKGGAKVSQDRTHMSDIGSRGAKGLKHKFPSEGEYREYMRNLKNAKKE